MDSITANVGATALKFAAGAGASLGSAFLATAVCGLIAWPKACLWGGVCSAIIFAAAVALVLPQQRTYKSIRKRMLSEGYEIEYECPATWLIESEPAGGYLFLCADEMVFVTHDVNKNTGFLALPYSIIDEVVLKSRPYLGLYLHDEATQYVSVPKRKDIKAYIEHKVAEQQPCN